MECEFISCGAKSDCIVLKGTRNRLKMSLQSRIIRYKKEIKRIQCTTNEVEAKESNKMIDSETPEGLHP